nr:serine/threonine-protein phosphatase 6 regulatory ankyrin repeat subunit a [Quercus suber]
MKSIENMSDIQREISGNQETTLHVAAAASQEDFVKNLVNILNSEDLAAINSVKNTALTYAALGGNVKIAEMMLEKNADLATLDSGVRPLYMAALSGHSAMAEFLYSKTREEVQKWDEDEQARLFITCVKNDIYGVALEMLEDNNDLARASWDLETALPLLARKPSAFYRARQSRMLRRLMSVINISWLNLEQENSTQSQANELLKKCLDNYRNDVEHFREFPEISEALFAAAEVGNIEFLVKLIRFDFSLLWEEENDKRIFHIAVEKRHENIFNLLYEIGPIKDLIVDKKDVGGNNMLHLVARMVPQEKLNAISGAALQMQRELLWFKVEKVVSPTFKEMKNTDGDTPYVLFEKSHRELRKEGEEWMRNTANSSMVVATLIGSIMFSVQPSDELKLNPILLLVYSISSATVLICSTTSLIMFLSILHSRYSYDDFLASLPIKLIIGVMSLFISIAAMMVAFCASFSSKYHNTHGFPLIVVLLVVFTFVPVLFVLLKYRLLVDIVQSTGFRFQPHQHVLFEQVSNAPLCGGCLPSRRSHAPVNAAIV